MAANATAEDARAALERFRQEFGPELDSNNLGPARSYLQVIRARVQEAAALLGL